MRTAGTLGEKIRALRKELKLTQQDLAGQDFTKSFISQVEKNQARPSLKSLQIIAARLNRPVSYFLGEEERVAVRDSGAELSGFLEMARTLEREGKSEKAIAALDQALQLCPGGDTMRRGTLQAAKARVALKQKDPDRALGFLSLALEDYGSSDDPEERAAVYNSMGAIYADHKAMYHKAADSYERALFLLDEKAADNPAFRARILTNLGISYCRLGSFDDATDCLTRAEGLCRKTGDYFKYGEICHTLGFIKEKQGDLDKALEFSERALHFYEAVGSLPHIARICVNLGIIQRSRGEPEGAAEFLDRAVKVATGANLKPDLANARQEYGRLRLAQGNHDEALHHLRTALEIEEEPTRRSDVLRAMAQAEKGKGGLDTAVIYLKQAALGYESGSRQRQLAECYFELGSIYREKGESEEATTYLVKSIESYKTVAECRDLTGTGTAGEPEGASRQEPPEPRSPQEQGASGAGRDLQDPGRDS
ncbi:MAG: tetratricopeptide repeat protein [Firmicutes bacterium]|nr:tetratricopeptide repeat protein [Bacillota bacterium]